MVAVPADIPETIPVAAPALATAGLILLHEPPAIALLNVVELPAHIEAVPVTGATALMVTVVVALQPPGVE